MTLVSKRGIKQALRIGDRQLGLLETAGYLVPVITTGRNSLYVLEVIQESLKRAAKPAKATAA